MAYFEPYIDANGIHVPTYADVMEYLQNQYKAIFGDDVYLGEETPDYQMMSVFGKCIEDYSALAIEAYNARDPQYASGDALDTLVQLSGMIRNRSTASTAVLTVSGEEGTEISAGSQAIDQGGNLWTIDSDVTIPASGHTTVNSTCETLGAVAAPAGYISGVYTPIPGWLYVTNETVAETGRDTESDAELRLRFADSHAITNSGIVDSIISGLRSVPGVEYVGLVENSTGTTDSNGLPGHSFCAIVEGGEDSDVAEKVFYLKPPGVATYGSAEETVIDTYGNSNTVYFTRPTSVDVSIVVSLVRTVGAYDSDRISSIIKSALEADINSLGIGKPWSVTMGYKDIYSAFDSSDIPFTITGISATNTHGTSTSKMTCLYNETLNTKDALITISVA